MGCDISCAEQQSCLYLCQISASSELVQNMLQKHAVKTKFWYVNVFSNQSLFVRVTEDQRYVIVLETRNRQKIFKQIFFCCLSSCYLQSMKKIQLQRHIYISQIRSRRHIASGDNLDLPIFHQTYRRLFHHESVN